MLYAVNMVKFLSWWERGLIAALCLSIAMLGIGRIEFLSTDVSMSGWSVSRTTFFFWLAFKLVVVARGGWPRTGLSQWKPLMPLFWFFAAVTVSLLPDFRQAGDYRYFFFFWLRAHGDARRSLLRKAAATMASCLARLAAVGPGRARFDA
jgi:hypothetical protein